MEFLKQHLWVLTVLALIVNYQSKAQVNPLPVQKIDSSMAVMAKPILILMSTDWCQYCEVQKKQLRKNDEFKNKAYNFYYVEFDAETKDSIVFNGHTYLNYTKRNRNGIHQLAFALNGSDSVAFPTWVLLGTKYQVLFRYNGVLKPLEIKELLQAIEKSG